MDELPNGQASIWKHSMAWLSNHHYVLRLPYPLLSILGWMHWRPWPSATNKIYSWNSCLIENQGKHRLGTLDRLQEYHTTALFQLDPSWTLQFENVSRFLISLGRQLPALFNDICNSFCTQMSNTFTRWLTVLHLPRLCKDAALMDVEDTSSTLNQKIINTNNTETFLSCEQQIQH